jgi:hypothetical protein
VDGRSPTAIFIRHKSVDWLASTDRLIVGGEPPGLGAASGPVAPIPVIPLATFIDYLDRHSGAFIALLTAVLVVVTAYYAIQTYRTVSEMKRARRESIRPKLALNFHRLGPTAMSVVIHNAGPGIAYDVNIKLRFEPLDEATGVHEQPWRHNVLGSGQRHDFLPPGGLNDNLNTLPATYARIRLLGTMKDSEGREYAVDETFADLAAWRQMLGDAHQRYVIPDPDRRLADEFGKRFETLTQDLGRRLDNIAVVLRGQKDPDDYGE